MIAILARKPIFQTLSINTAQKIISLFLASFMLASCGGGSGGTVSNIEGAWRSSLCERDGGDSIKIEFSVNGSNFTFSEVMFVNTTNCSGALTITTHTDGTFNILEASSDSDSATQVNITATRGRLTASQAFIAALEAQGTSLQAIAASQGIADINNVQIDTQGTSTTLYTIYSLDGNTLRFGMDSPSLDGSTPELRHIILDDTETFTRI